MSACRSSRGCTSRSTIGRRSTTSAALPLLTLRPIDPRGWQFAIKHAFDRAFALVALVGAAQPVLIAWRSPCGCNSPGPILFRQRRVGRDGREFDVLKFRTMREREPAVVSGFELPDRSGARRGRGRGPADPRRAGSCASFSLDELPQLINVCAAT